MLDAQTVARRAAYLMFDIHSLAVEQPVDFKRAAWLSRELFLEVAGVNESKEKRK